VPRHFHPARMDRFSPPGPGSHLLLQVRNNFSVTVHDTVGIVVLQAGTEQAVVFPVCKFVQAIVISGLPTPKDIELLHVLAVRGNLHRELPALDLKDDAHGLDTPFFALGHKFRVVHEAVEACSGVQFSERFIFQIRQGNRAAAHHRPYQNGRLVFFQVLHHLHCAVGKARMITVIVVVPPVEINASFHSVPH